jgi:hypothetical protein
MPGIGVYFCPNAFVRASAKGKDLQSQKQSQKPAQPGSARQADLTLIQDSHCHKAMYSEMQKEFHLGLFFLFNYYYFLYSFLKFQKIRRK